MKKENFICFEKWEEKTNKLGWVHCHDNFVVCDDTDTDKKVGWLTIQEWGSK